MGVALRKDSRALEHASYAGLSEKWVSACDLKNGDKVLLSDGTLCEVEGVTLKQLETPETTYNLEVADFHTYYVSDACVLVHNANCGDFKKVDPRRFEKTYNLREGAFHRQVKPAIKKLSRPGKTVGNNPDILMNKVGDIAYQGANGRGFQETGKNISEILKHIAKGG